MAAQNFDSIYQGILKSEGGLSNRNAASGDPGGRTMMGVTQGTYNSWRNMNGLPSQDVANISPDEHRTIFKSQYWDPIRGDDLPHGLDYAVMDSAINSGPSRAVRLLQRTLGLDEDGRMGGDTLAAVSGMDPSTALGQFTANRRAFQLNLSNAAQNPGWGPRIDKVNADAAAAIRNGGFGGNTLPAPAPGSDLFGKGFDASGDAGAGNVGQNGAAPPYLGPGLSFPGGDDGFGAIGDPNFGAGISPYQPFSPSPPFNSNGAFGVGNALGVGAGDIGGFLPATPETFGGFGSQFNVPQFGGDFGLPQAQGVDPGNPFGQLPGLTTDPNYGAPDLVGVDPNAGFNPGQFFGGGLGVFGGGFGGYNPFGGAGIPGLGGFPQQQAGVFGAPGAFGTNPFDGTDAATLGPDGTAATQGPGAAADLFGFGGQAVSPFGFNGAFTSPFGFGGYNASPFGFNGATASPLGFNGAFAPTLGFDGTEAGTVGPDGVPTQGAGVAADPFGFNGSFASPFGAPGAINPFGGGFGAFNASPFGRGFGAFNAPTLGFNGTDAPTLGPDQFATATDQAGAPDLFGFSGQNFGGGLGAMPQGFGGGFGGFNPFGGGFNPTVNGVSVGGIGGFGNPFGGFNPGGFGGVGAQNFGDLYSVPAAPAPAPAAPGPFDFGGNNFGGGLGAMPQSFGGGFGGFNPFGGNSGGIGGFGGNPFGGFNPGGFGGAGAQSFGDLYGVGAPAAPAAPAPSPFGFGGDVSGFDPNAGAAPAAPADDGGAGASADFGGSGFDSAGSERAFLAMQAQQIAAQQAAGQSAAANNPNVWNQQLFALTPPAPAPTSFIPQTPAYAGVPTAPGFSAPAPVLPQINIPNFSAAGIGNIGFGSLGIR